ncbi:DUF4956 domain-containing protein [Breznakiellaceae bacterium SP9]
MPDPLLFSTPVEMTTTGIAFCSVISLLLGIITALVYKYNNTANKNFIVTIAMLPLIVQAVIMIVNGNVGTGIAVMGAFNLVRFRSVPGTAREITCVLLTMSIGLITGAGHIFFAFVFTLFLNGILILFVKFNFGEQDSNIRYLKILIPEDLDYTTAFDAVFSQYTQKCSLDKVRTTNLGSLYQLQYTVSLRDIKKEKEFLDSIRLRNSNLDIASTRIANYTKEDL